MQEKYGKWTVLEKNTGNTNYWKCRCDCGTEKLVYKYNLTSNKTKSCGCSKEERFRELGKNRIHDLTGKRFGDWTVLERAKNKRSQTYWKCQCSCGTIRDINAGRLKDGSSTSCGCRKTADLTGKRFGSWTVISPSQRIRPNGHACTTWLCECDCGTRRYVDANSLIQGTSVSCGCKKSKGEEEIASYFENNGISYVREYGFEDLRGPSGKILRFDFALFDSDGFNSVIEFQGKQHFFPDKNWRFGRQQREVTDPLKKEYCKANNIRLFEITYKDDILAELDKITDIVYGNSVPSDQ